MIIAGHFVTVREPTPSANPKHAKDSNVWPSDHLWTQACAAYHELTTTRNLLKTTKRSECCNIQRILRIWKKKSYLANHNLIWRNLFLDDTRISNFWWQTRELCSQFPMQRKYFVKVLLWLVEYPSKSESSNRLFRSQWNFRIGEIRKLFFLHRATLYAHMVGHQIHHLQA